MEIGVWSLDGEEKAGKMKTPEHQNTRTPDKDIKDAASMVQERVGGAA